MDVPEPQPTRNHRWFQFSLRSMLIVMTVVAVWLGFHCQAANRQREAADAIRAFGGWTYYDYEMPGGRFNAQATSIVPAWLSDRIGVDFFHSVVEVNLIYNDHGPRRLDNRNLSDEALRYLCAFPKLRALWLTKTQATDDGLKYVGQLKSLEKLVMSDAKKLSDAGMAHLVGLTRLRKLHCNGAKITDESLRVLATLPNIEELSLQENYFTDAGLAHLKGMKKLEVLHVGLHAQGITDEGLTYLTELTTLKALDLQSAEVTSEGLLQLKDLKNLEQLWLGRCTVEDIGVVRRALPNCKILY